jgi:hypothetical protein
LLGIGEWMLVVISPAFRLWFIPLPFPKIPGLTTKSACQYGMPLKFYLHLFWWTCYSLYSALPERSGAFCWRLEDQPRYFKSQVLVQGCKMGSKEWMWKNKWNWKLFEIYNNWFHLWQIFKNL